MWVCCQIGAREHYAIPRVLHRRGRLLKFYTDAWAGSWLHKLSRVLPLQQARALAARFHPDLKSASVKAWNFRGIGRGRRARDWLHRSKVRKLQSIDDGPYNSFVEVGRWFSQKTAAALQQHAKLPDQAIVFAYDTGALELFRWCRQRGIKTVLGQMDPNRLEVELVQAEERRWPGWTKSPLQVPEAYFRRREQEWGVADRIVVNSAFCRDALLRQGVPAEKLVVVPLCYETVGTAPQFVPRSAHGGESLRVLFLGQVILRKGIQYLMAAAHKLGGENIHFDVVGPVGLSPTALATVPRNMTFHGRAGRDQVAAWYQRADVFVLPTLSDGFALTQLEAMAYGLPVVATPCCGAVVADGGDGFVVPARDSDALVQILQRYLATPDLLSRQRLAALEKAKQFTLDRLAENLLQLEASLLPR